MKPCNIPYTMMTPSDKFFVHLLFMHFAHFVQSTLSKVRVRCASWASTCAKPGEKRFAASGSLQIHFVTDLSTFVAPLRCRGKPLDLAVRLRALPTRFCTLRFGMLSIASVHNQLPIRICSTTLLTRFHFAHFHIRLRIRFNACENADQTFPHTSHCFACFYLRSLLHLKTRMSHQHLIAHFCRDLTSSVHVLQFACVGV